MIKMLTRAVAIVGAVNMVLVLLHTFADLNPAATAAVAAVGGVLATANVILAAVGCLLLVRRRRAPDTAEALLTGPRPPQGVRAVFPGGRTVPVEVVYAGYRDGRHHWEAPIVLGHAPQALQVDVLPAHTLIDIRWAEP